MTARPGMGWSMEEDSVGHGRVSAVAGSEWASSIQSGGRFAFGQNWQRFLARLDERRIEEACVSLCTMLGRTDLQGVRFLDIGSGSGLFSLAARRLGATVHSFDFDPMSVACTAELKRRYFPEDKGWTIDEASILDEGYVHKL